LHTKCCEFFVEFSYDLDETQPVASAGNELSRNAGAARHHCGTLSSPQAAWRRWDKETPMLWTIFVILLVLWLFGMVSSYTIGGFIHILLVIAVVVLLIRLIQGRRPIP
jgi:hypothetical protein